MGLQLPACHSHCHCQCQWADGFAPPCQWAALSMSLCPFRRAGLALNHFKSHHVKPALPFMAPKQQGRLRLPAGRYVMLRPQRTLEKAAAPPWKNSPCQRPRLGLRAVPGRQLGSMTQFLLSPHRQRPLLGRYCPENAIPSDWCSCGHGIPIIPWLLHCPRGTA